VIKKRKGEGGIHEVLEEVLERCWGGVGERVNRVARWIRQETEFWRMKEWNTTGRGRRQETEAQEAQEAKEAGHPS
jgi:hypothetical protein